MHGGIEPSIIASKLAHADIAGRVAELRKVYQGRYVFVGIDKVGSSGNDAQRNVSQLGVLEPERSVFLMSCGGTYRGRHSWDCNT